MKTEDYIAIQKLIEKIEKDKATGKIILFFDGGTLKGLEHTTKRSFRLAVLDSFEPPVLD